MKKFILLFILSTAGFDSYATTCPNLTTSYQLEKKFVFNDIRVFYSLEEPEKLINLIDSNNNDIPDYVENIAIQADTMLKAADELGFRSPFNSPRYADTNTQYIDFLVIKDVSTGASADEAYILTGVTAGADNKCSIRSTINNGLSNITTRTNTLTIAHEVGHHIYNSYSMYQQNWFEGQRVGGSWITESFSEWLEIILRQGELRNTGMDTLPATLDEIKSKILTQSYDASKVLDRIIKLADKGAGTVSFSNQLMQTKYIDGVNVIQDQNVRGVAIIKKILEKMDTDDDLLAQKYNLNLYKWPERYQRGCEPTPARYCSDEISKRTLDIYKNILLEIPNDELTSSEKYEINNFINAVNSYQYWEK